MSNTFSAKKQKPLRGSLILNSEELFYLRLYAHGLNDTEISDFMELKQYSIKNIKDAISNKYDSENWVKIVTKALKNNVLQKQDFVGKPIKEVALKFTHIIYNQFFSTSSSKTFLNSLRFQIQDYYDNCQAKLIEEYKNKDNTDKLTSEELLYIALKFNDLSPVLISKRLNINLLTDTTLKSLEQSIFKKLKVSNWFNIFKVSMALNLLERPKNYDNILRKEIIYSAKKIIRVLGLKRLQDSEKRLSVYIELLDFYANVELSKVLCKEEDVV